MERTLFPTRRTTIPLNKERINPSVYLLYMGKEIVYIGQSLCPEERIFTHKSQGRIMFDSYNLIPCKEEELVSLEAHLIFIHYPKYNRSVSIHKLPSIHRLGYLSEKSTNNKNEYTVPLKIVGKHIFIDLTNTGIIMYRKLDRSDEK